MLMWNVENGLIRSSWCLFEGQRGLCVVSSQSDHDSKSIHGIKMVLLISPGGNGPCYQWDVPLCTWVRAPFVLQSKTVRQVCGHVPHMSVRLIKALISVHVWVTTQLSVIFDSGAWSPSQMWLDEGLGTMRAGLTCRLTTTPHHITVRPVHRTSWSGQLSLFKMWREKRKTNGKSRKSKLYFFTTTE